MLFWKGGWDFFLPDSCVAGLERDRDHFFHDPVSV